jgi:hypothetical protein
MMLFWIVERPLTNVYKRLIGYSPYKILIVPDESFFYFDFCMYRFATFLAIAPRLAPLRFVRITTTTFSFG